MTEIRVDSSLKVLVAKRFASFEELAEAAIAWNFDFRQVSKNYSDTTLEQIQVGRILLSHLSCGCFSTHAGETPGNMYTIGLPDIGSSEFRYSGRKVDRPVLIFTRAGQEFDVMARPGYGISTFSIPQSVLEEYCESKFDGPLEIAPGFRSGVFSADWQTVMKLRSMARSLSGLAHGDVHSSGPPVTVQSFESQLLECLGDFFRPANRIKRELDAARSGRGFKRARHFAGIHEHDFLKVRDLAAAACVSERTLERSFHREFGISPKKYLLGRRMYGAHRELWHSGSTGKSVADIANAWGFWHIGQFSKDYRRLFGELPSETQSRSG